MKAIRQFVDSVSDPEREIQLRQKLDKIIRVKYDAIRMQQLSVFCYQSMLVAPDLFNIAIELLESLALSSESNFYLREVALIKTFFNLLDLRPDLAYQHFEELSRLLSDYKEDQATVRLHNDLIVLFKSIIFNHPVPAGIVRFNQPRMFAIFWLYRILGKHEAQVTNELPRSLEQYLNEIVQHKADSFLSAWYIYWLAKLAAHVYPMKWPKAVSVFIKSVEQNEHQFLTGSFQFSWIAFFGGETGIMEQVFSPGTSGWMQANAIIFVPDAESFAAAASKTALPALLLQPGFSDCLKSIAERGNSVVFPLMESRLSELDFYIGVPALYRLSTSLAGVFDRQEQFENSWMWWRFATRLVDLQSNPGLLMRVQPFSNSMAGLPGHSAFLYDHLRSRAHTHFLFNSLNSIHLAIYDLSAVQINVYLRQIRRIINYRFSTIFISTISLAEEIQFLYDYLCLEQLRFKSRLEFDLRIDVSSDLRHIQIAPMMIQPLVENAIKHGIRNLENGKLLLEIKEQKRGFLKITVQDNGVGRRRAAALKRKSNEPQSEQGTKLLNFGFKMIEILWGKMPELKYRDSDRGTGVILQMPYKLNYD